MTEQNDSATLPFFDLEVNYDPELQTVTLFANNLALEVLINMRPDLLQGSPHRHYHLSPEVDGINGNVRELLLIKR